MRDPWLAGILTTLLVMGAFATAQQRVRTPRPASQPAEAQIPSEIWSLYTSTINEIGLSFWLPFGFERLPKLYRNLLIDQTDRQITFSEPSSLSSPSCPQIHRPRNDSAVMSIQIVHSSPATQQYQTDVTYIGCDGSPAFSERLLVCGPQPTFLSSSEVLSGQRSFAPQPGESCRVHSFTSGQGQEFFRIENRQDRPNSWITEFSTGSTGLLRVHLLQRFLSITPLDISEGFYFEGRYFGNVDFRFDDFFIVARKESADDFGLRYHDNEFNELSQNEFEKEVQKSRNLLEAIAKNAFFNGFILSRLPNIVEDVISGSNRAFILELEQMINRLRIGGQENIDQTIDELEALIFAIQNGQFIPQDLRPRN